jgi:hypothetical protein
MRRLLAVSSSQCELCSTPLVPRNSTDGQNTLGKADDTQFCGLEKPFSLIISKKKRRLGNLSGGVQILRAPGKNALLGLG